LPEALPVTDGARRQRRLKGAVDAPHSDPDRWAA
jgi:hypothetical protein